MAGYLAYIHLIDQQGGNYPSQGLPGGQGGVPTHPIYMPGFPSQGLPPFPSQGLPGGGGYPDQGLPPGQGGQPSHPWVPPPGKPEHPIVLPPGQTPPAHPSHPIEGVSWGFAMIYMPGQPMRWTAFPVEDAAPDQGLPGSQPRPDNTLPGDQPRPDNSPPGPQPTPTPQRR